MKDTTTIRITIQRCWKTSVWEFPDTASAAKWLTEDSYFDNENVTAVYWERVKTGTGPQAGKTAI